MEVTPVRREKLYNLIIHLLSDGKERTAREMSIELYRIGKVAYPTRDAVQPRLTELEKLGRIEVCGSKIDEATRKHVSIYRLVGDA